MEKVSYTPKKLKHAALKEIHYQLLNTCLIISNLCWRYCLCHHYQECRERPSHKYLLGERCLCCICQIKRTFNLDRMYKLNSIQEVWKLYLALKKDLLEYLFTGGARTTNFWLYHYSTPYRLKRKRTKILLKNYIKESYIQICFLDP